MDKKRILGSLALAVSIGITLSFCILSCFAEDITITTYYPAPFGVYNEMRTNKLVIGDPDSASTPSPNTDGVTRFRGLSSNPVGSDDTEPGALYYNTSDSEFKYYDGTGWQALGGGGPGSWTCTQAEGNGIGMAIARCPAGLQNEGEKRPGSP